MLKWQARGLPFALALNARAALAASTRLLPVAGFAAFGLFIDSLTHFGLWAVFKTLTAPLWDPFGRGLWPLGLLLSGAVLTGAAFFEDARPYGFGAIALAGSGHVRGKVMVEL